MTEPILQRAGLRHPQTWNISFVDHRIAERGKRRAGLADLLGVGIEHDVDVLMGPTLTSADCVDSPPSGKPAEDPTGLERREGAPDIFESHPTAPLDPSGRDELDDEGPHGRDPNHAFDRGHRPLAELTRIIRGSRRSPDGGERIAEHLHRLGLVELRLHGGEPSVGQALPQCRIVCNIGESRGHEVRARRAGRGSPSGPAPRAPGCLRSVSSRPARRRPWPPSAPLEHLPRSSVGRRRPPTRTTGGYRPARAGP